MANLGSIHTYRSEVDRIIRIGGSRNEATISRAVFNLINAYARPHDLLLLEQLPYFNPARKKTVRPDGTLKNTLRIDQGFWESKDTNDDLTEEIKKKFDRGYPDSNILFEDSQTAILYQDGRHQLTAPFAQAEALDELLTAYVSFENQDVLEFRKAVERFKDDIPNIVTALRGMILQQGKANAAFRTRRQTFLELCRSAINPAVTPDDVDEMLIQHILTEEIFLSIFSDTQLLDENNIARELKQVENTFFTGATKRDTLGQIKHYYECIKAHATSIVSPREKQTFLKVIYENFYKAYNPKGADRLGIIYTPGEIVDFMIRSTDTLLNRHFKDENGRSKGLADKEVEILDPATGTGSYVCDLIEYLPREVLARKYKNELHANEVAILPYYIANLNIETAYAAKMGSYAPFENICFVDTLDNTEGLRVANQWELGAMSVENTRRIKQQNLRKISVIIGNPPYRANQESENDNNKNRTYKHIDGRIKATYIAASTAQKTKLYDPYVRFIRWASDRLADQGIVSFVTNSSFVHKRTFDGFRKCAAQEFDAIYIYDFKGYAHTSGELRQREGGNIFNDKIKLGIAIYFLVKTGKKKGCTIRYKAVDDYLSADDKLAIVSAAKIEMLDMDRIEPDANGNWLNTEANDSASNIPVAARAVKLGKSQEAIFGLFSLGVVTNRDDWVYGEHEDSLLAKMNFLNEVYNADVRKLKGVADPNLLDYSIKWTRAVKQNLEKGLQSKIEGKHIVDALYRPFTHRKLYYSGFWNEMRYQMPQIFPENGQENEVIIISNSANRKPFFCLAANTPFDLNFVADPGECLPFYRYDEDGNRQDNLTDWGLRQFQKHYGDAAITKRDIFHYAYAVLHHPAYRTKYEINLKREFPRLPFYADFRQWSAWGQSLLELHLNYEQATPFKLERRDREESSGRSAGLQPALDVRQQVKPTTSRRSDEKPQLKPKLKAVRETGSIEIDATTTLHGIPAAAWDYKLGNRSGLEWVLDQWKEHKISDPTVAAKFNTYRFADHKEQVIELLQRVCTVSVETMKIVNALPELKERKEQI